MNVIWSDRASRHIASIYLHIEADSPQSAESQVLRIFKTVNLLRAFPAMGRLARDPDVRELIIPKTPYIVTYKMAEGAVQIVAVLHGSQRWPADLWPFTPAAVPP